MWSSASEIGADLHTMSHRLHSSALESLGLVAGLGAYCRDFTDRNGVERSRLPTKTFRAPLIVPRPCVSSAFFRKRCEM